MASGAVALMTEEPGPVQHHLTLIVMVAFLLAGGAL